MTDRSTEEFVAGIRARAARRRARRRRVLVWTVASTLIVVAAAALVGSQLPRSPATSSVAPAGATVAPSGASTSPAPNPTSGSSPAAPGPSPTSPTSAAAGSLAELALAPAGEESYANDYDRDRFGQTWADVDRNGCDTRNDILRRDLVDLVLKADTNGCKVLAGTLIDPYDGVAVSFVSGGETSRLVQIDHIIALAWAWRHGADLWSDETRERFANDPLNLQATTEDANQAKSDDGPSEWLPTSDAGRCFYAERFISVLRAYGLTIGAGDRATLQVVLHECD